MLEGGIENKTSAFHTVILGHTWHPLADPVNTRQIVSETLCILRFESAEARFQNGSRI